VEGNGKGRSTSLREGGVNYAGYEVASASKNEI